MVAGAVLWRLCVLQETLLCWLETFAARLEGDMYRAERLIPDMPDSTGLNLFPLNGPEVRQAGRHLLW